MKIKDGPIIPGVGISNIKLEIGREELLSIIGNEYEEENLDPGSIISIENAKIWIADDGKVDQIGVGKDFHGKYKNIIGIGSTMLDVKRYFGDYVNIYCTYEIKNIDGMCFELEDVEDYEDEWDELTAPIEFIYVYRGHQQ